MPSVNSLVCRVKIHTSLPHLTYLINTHALLLKETTQCCCTRLTDQRSQVGAGESITPRVSSNVLQRNSGIQPNTARMRLQDLEACPHIGQVDIDCPPKRPTQQRGSAAPKKKKKIPADHVMLSLQKSLTQLVQASGTQHRRVNDIWAVGGANHKDLLLVTAIKAIQFLHRHQKGKVVKMMFSRR